MNNNTVTAPASYNQSIAEYKQRPDATPPTEQQKRWLSWNAMVASGRKLSYSGTVPKSEIKRRRAKSKAARAARRNNR